MSLGLAAVGHPVLGAAVESADTGELLLTGRVSRQALPWLADHEVSGHQLVPGAALVEWALRAADEAGCAAVEELVLHTSTVLPRDGGLTVQLAVGTPGGDGRRELRVYSRFGEHGGRFGDEGGRSGERGGWVCRASGTLSPEPVRPATGEEEEWPPPGAEPVEAGHVYDRAAAAGYGYGPAFQGLRALWRRGGELFAEIALPENAGAPDGFGIHPVLLDAALHPVLAVARLDDGTVLLPFTWSGVSLHATAASTIRVTLTPLRSGQEDTGYRLSATDPAGAPVVDVETVTMRPAGLSDIAVGAADARGLFGLEWTPHQPTRSAGADQWLTAHAGQSASTAGQQPVPGAGKSASGADQLVSDAGLLVSTAGQPGLRCGPAAGPRCG